MGLFDKLRGVHDNDSTVLNEREAVAAVLMVILHCDGKLSEDDAQLFVEIVNHLKLYNQESSGGFEKLTEKLFAMLHTVGPLTMLDLAADAMSAESCETAFAVAADVIYADGYVEDEEKQMLEEIQERLALPEDIALKILEVIMIKNRVPGN